MSPPEETQTVHDTARLLSELDDALDYSSALRELLDKYETLRDLENMTGPSRITRVLRREINSMENRLAQANG